MKRNLLLPLFCLATSWASAQEFNATVKINSDQIEGTYKDMFVTLEQDLTELINTTRWSELNFSNQEKIDCTFQLNISAVPSADRYAAELIVQARRPVFQSVYTTSTFNFRDSQFEFPYVENEPLVFSEYQVDQNLVGVISYYLYLILGVDADSFAPYSGTPYYERAQQIVTQAQSLNEKGWAAFEDSKNRHALVTGLLEEPMKPIRELSYSYHRQGLDVMAQHAEKGRQAITQSLENLQTTQQANSMSVLLSVFIDTKLEELINIYSEAPQQEKQAVYDLLQDIYPAHSQRLSEIKKSHP